LIEDLNKLNLGEDLTEDEGALMRKSIPLEIIQKLLMSMVIPKK
jgi:hypothetical protein